MRGERRGRRTPTARAEGPRRRDLVPVQAGASGNLSRRLEALAASRGSALEPVSEAENRLLPLSEERTAPISRRVNSLFARQATAWSNADFHPYYLQVDDEPKSPARLAVIFTLLALLATALAWSYFGRLASYTAATGKIQTAGRTKVLEALTAGKIVKIRGGDGDAVKAGAILVELDPTDALAQRTIIHQKLTDVRAETLRLRTEMSAARQENVDPQTKISWGKGVPVSVRAREDGVARADLAKLAAQITTLRSEKRAKEAERDKFAANIGAQKALVAVTQENLAMVESLLKSGYNSAAKYLDMKAQLDDQQVTQTAYEGSLEKAKQAIFVIDSEIAKTREVFVTDATQTVSKNEQTIVDLTQQLVRADQILSNMTLRTPVTGVVHATTVKTIGQVVKPKQQLMQIVPSDAPLEIIAYVPNTEIGFIRKGDEAKINVTAFNFKTYGSLQGKVTEVANDALSLQGKSTLQSSSLDGEYQSTSAAQKTGNLQFPILVRASRSTMTVEGKEIPLLPGMGVSVEILTENRRAIDYILSPLEDLFSTAGHERD